MGLATTALRLVTGGTMAAHGLSKITTNFGRGGPEATAGSFEKMGFSPSKAFGMATGGAETVGGLMMVAGLGTPWACAMISGVMTGAIAKVHLENGFWASESGFEYNLHILAATFAVAGGGGGALTLDGLRGKKRKGLHWALLQLALGAGAAAGALALAERRVAAAPGTGIPAGGDGSRWATSQQPRTSDGLVDLTDSSGGLGSASAPSPVAAQA